MLKFLTAFSMALAIYKPLIGMNCSSNLKGISWNTFVNKKLILQPLNILPSIDQIFIHFLARAYVSKESGYDWNELSQFDDLMQPHLDEGLEWNDAVKFLDPKMQKKAEALKAVYVEALESLDAHAKQSGNWMQSYRIRWINLPNFIGTTSPLDTNDRPVAFLPRKARLFWAKKLKQHLSEILMQNYISHLEALGWFTNPGFEIPLSDESQLILTALREYYETPKKSVFPEHLEVVPVSIFEHLHH